jgi:prepilin-type N-terminal cleavage/methylation domain-containing protein/prepilin-type processing-associated H-X9-DG protein
MRNRGFTLVELLVVMGIIAALMGLLFPTVRAANERSRSTRCLSNLRQLATAATSYCMSEKGVFPPASSGTRVVNGKTINEAWDFITERDTATGVITSRPGTLWRGQAPMEIQQCPSFAGAANASDPYTGYNYNTSYIGHGVGESHLAPARLAQIKQPSRTALFGDGEYYAGANKFMRAPFPDPNFDTSTSTRAAGTQGFRHMGTTSVAFVDGHAEALKDRFSSTIPSQQARIGPKTGFLSADNSIYDLE